MGAKPLNLIKNAAKDYVEDEAPIVAAALSFYTALALAPLLVILITVAGLLGPDLQRQFIDTVSGMMGADTGRTIAEIIGNAEARQRSGLIGSIFSFLVLLFGAAGVFAQLQYALNRMWDVKAKPGQGLWQWVRKRLLSIGMLLAVVFLLVVSLAVTTVLNSVFVGDDILSQVLNVVVSILVITLLFALIYKYLPDVKIGWRDVWVGALITSILFVIGKYAIGAYLGRSAVSSTYGAAGSLMVMLLWVYYSSLIVFFGAELTQAWATQYGRKMEPEPQAQWSEEPSAAPS